MRLRICISDKFTNDNAATTQEPHLRTSALGNLAQRTSALVYPYFNFGEGLVLLRCFLCHSYFLMNPTCVAPAPPTYQALDWMHNMSVGQEAQSNPPAFERGKSVINHHFLFSMKAFSFVGISLSISTHSIVFLDIQEFELPFNSLFEGTKTCFHLCCFPRPLRLVFGICGREVVYL